jgi:hypothetical protein
MKEFWIYTLARLGVFAVSYVVVWFVADWLWAPPALWRVFEPGNLILVFAALVISSIVALLGLGRLRENLAASVQRRASAINEKIEESRRAEDVD